jgi:uncharacterized protein (DUF169 family)
MDFAQVGKGLQELLGLQRQAVAIAFLDKAPAGVARVKAPQPASCSYWRLASDGEVFYTTTDDHQGCVIGAYTHNVALSPEKSTELNSMLGQMIGMKYIREEEIAQIPHNKEPFQVAVYSPLTLSPCEPQVVVVRGSARQVMVLAEATARAGIASSAPTIRPTCAFLPGTIQTGNANPSFACIGNRVYSDMADDELYYAIPGARVGEVVDQLETIVSANQTLEGFHQARCSCA